MRSQNVINFILLPHFHFFLIAIFFATCAKFCYLKKKFKGVASNFFHTEEYRQSNSKYEGRKRRFTNARKKFYTGMKALDNNLFKKISGAGSASEERYFET